MSQTVRPTSTVTNSNWPVTGSSAHAALADDSDATFCAWALGGNTLEVKFGTFALPSAGTGTLYLKTFFSATLTYTILQGTTTIQTGTAATGEDGITENSITITAPNMLNITDGSDIRVRLVGSGFGGGSVYEAEFTAPDAPVAKGGNMPLMGVG